MSVRHPNISAWSRDGHEGSYTTELFGWTLRVAWSPNTRTERGHFRWEATREGERLRHGHEHFEEIEAAMADAEEWARHEAAHRAFQAEQQAKEAEAAEHHADDDAA